MAETYKHSDCLNTIRLLGAFQVFYYHAIIHLHVDMPDAVTHSVLFIMGVPIFFFLSGYLNWFSSKRSVNAVDYYKKRFWRIYPELWVAVLFEIVSIVVLYKQTISWPLLGTFAFTQGSFLQFWTPEFLRGYGCGCPNGALWTICMIIQYYLVAYPLQHWLIDKKLRTWSLLLGLSIVIGILSKPLVSILPMMVGKLYGQLIFRYFWLFFLGAFVGRYSKNFLPYLKKYFPLMLLLSGVVMLSNFDITIGHYGVIRSLLFCLGALGLSYTCPWLNVKIDISYAMYIYHMIVVNAFIELGLTGLKLYLVGAVIIVLIVSFVSTLTIGQFSKSWKRRFTNSSL